MESSLVNKKELEFVESYADDGRKLQFVAGPGKIISISPWALAKDIGLEVGDEILEINGSKLRDIMDFQFELSELEEVELLVRRSKPDPELLKQKEIDPYLEIIQFEKDIGEDLGVEFESPLFNGVKECANKCAFCFIDQQPMEMTRDSLHLKDDDFRLSYLHGSYVTLTNLSRSDRKRIEELRPGPLYVSVHATDPELRNKLLGRKSSTPITDELKWLDSLGIPVHTQIVLCPEWNDGENLIQTINDLYKLKDKPVRSVAIVPVGLTKYHNGGLRRHNLEEALATIDLVEKWSADNERNFAFLSDEFYLMTGTPIPNYADYGGYPQLEDGVGVTSLFIEEFSKEIDKLPEEIPEAKTITWVNGTISRIPIKKIAELINKKVKNLKLKVVFIESKFWGTTNVTGLLTGQDFIDGLGEIPHEELGEKLIIPGIALKENEDIFLDDMSFEEFEKKIGIPCVKAWGAQEFVEALTTI